MQVPIVAVLRQPMQIGYELIDCLILLHMSVKPRSIIDSIASFVEILLKLRFYCLVLLCLIIFKLNDSSRSSALSPID